MDRKPLIKKYFEEHSFVQSDIESFNNFVEIGMQSVIDNLSDIIPTITPQEAKDFKIKFEKIWIENPQIIEADGSKRKIYPQEARLRATTYSAPIFVEVSVYVDGVQRESFTTQIGKLPIMLRSKYCNLKGMGEKELIEKGEDPNDPGGYFILNGNERVLITVEDLASNKLFVEKQNVGPSKYIGKIFSEMGAYRVPHLIEQMKDGSIYLSFTRFKRIPVIAIIKALGLTADEDIMNNICGDQKYSDVFINLYQSVELKKEDDALDFIARKIGITQTKDIRISKSNENLDRYLLPHLGTSPKDRMSKALNLCKIIKKFLFISKNDIKIDKDNYINKKLKLSGDLLLDLFRVNLRALINDLLYNFQRLVKRGKFTSLKIIIRDKLLTARIKSAMATGNWIGGRRGISQNMDRTNYLSSLSHLQRVVSLLSATQENFEARALHATHWGRLCPIETPEGTPIGLRKNLALLSKITQDYVPEIKIKKALEGIGLEK